MKKNYILVTIDAFGSDGKACLDRYPNKEERQFNLTDNEAAIVRRVLEMSNDPRDPSILVGLKS